MKRARVFVTMPPAAIDHHHVTGSQRMGFAAGFMKTLAAQNDDEFHKFMAMRTHLGLTLLAHHGNLRAGIAKVSLEADAW